MNRNTDEGICGGVSPKRRGFAEVLRTHWPFALVIIYGTFDAIYALLNDTFFNVFESGVYYAAVRRLCHGQMFYRDFFWPYGPFFILPQFLGYLVFGNPISADMALIPVCFITVFITYKLAQRFTSNQLLQFITVWVVYDWAGLGIRGLLPILCLWLLPVDERCAYWRIFSIGLLVGLSGFIQQDLWPATGAALAMWLAYKSFTHSKTIRESIRASIQAVAVLTMGAVTSLLCVLCFLWSQHALQEFWLYACVFPIREYVNRHFVDYPKPWELPQQSIDSVSIWSRLPFAGPLIRWVLHTVPFYLVPATYLGVIGLFIIRRKDHGLDDRMLAVVLFGLLSFRTVINVPDEPHLQVNAWPAAIVAPALLEQICLQTVRGPRLRNFFYSVCLVASIGFCIYPLVHHYYHLSGPSHEIPFGIHGKTHSEEWPVAWKTSQYVISHTKPSDSILALPTCPMLYVLTNRNNATEFDYLEPMNKNIGEARILERIQRTPPKLCVIRRNFKIWQNEFGQDFGKQIYAWILDKYVPVQEYGDYLILGPKQH